MELNITFEKLLWIYTGLLHESYYTQRKGGGGKDRI